MALPERIVETSKQVGAFFKTMETQPLSLALVVMNFVLLGYLFYSGSSSLEKLRRGDELAPGVMKMVLDAVQAQTRPAPAAEPK